MNDRQTADSANVISLDAARERRSYIALANGHESFIQTRASFALSGIDLTDDDAERAGRLLAGVVTHEQAVDEIRRKYGFEEFEGKDSL